MSGGVLLTLAGVWVLTQILGGNALGRLGIAGQPTTPDKPLTNAGATVGSVAGGVAGLGARHTGQG